MTTRKDIEAMNTEVYNLWKAMLEAGKERKRLEAQRYIDLENMIAELDTSKTAKQISAMTNGDFSWQSISSLGYNADWFRQNRPFCYGASCPRLKRVKVTKIRKFAELDDNGNVIPDTITEREDSHYEYFINK